MKTAFSLLLVAQIVTFGHSGGTDSKGGHHDRKSGTYHFHHGMKAHDHPGGVCSFTKNPASKKPPKPQPDSK